MLTPTHLKTSRGKLSSEKMAPQRLSSSRVQKASGDVSVPPGMKRFASASSSGACASSAASVTNKWRGSTHANARPVLLPCEVRPFLVSSSRVSVLGVCTRRPSVSVSVVATASCVGAPSSLSTGE